MVKGETYNLQLFESEAFRHFASVFTNKQSGITQGCEVTQNSQNISVSKGYFFIQGGLLRETTGVSNEIPTDAGYYKLVYEIDLSKTNTKDEFNQGSYKFVKSLGSYPALTQEDLNDEGTIYQLPFCQFVITEQGLQNFKDIRPIINYGVYEQKGTIIYENSNGINTNFSLENDLQGKEKIKVYYCGRNPAIGNDIECVKEIPVVNGKANSSLDALYSGSINLWIMRTEISISGTEVSLTNNIVNVLGEEVSVRQEASIYITKILII